MAKNFYSEKPVITYKRTPAKWESIVTILAGLNFPLEILRSAFVIMANETGYGKRIICDTNVGGIQSDSGRWPAKWDNAIVGTTLVKGNREGYVRGFVVFDTLNNAMTFLCERIQARGLFIGGFAHKYYKLAVNDVNDLCEAYNHEWVFGEVNETPNTDDYPEKHKGFKTIYDKAVLALPSKDMQTVTIVTKQDGSSVNVRSGAGTSFAVVNTVKAKTVAQLLERGSEWSKVQVKGSIGFIRNDFLM